MIAVFVLLALFIFLLQACVVPSPIAPTPAPTPIPVVVSPAPNFSEITSLVSKSDCAKVSFKNRGKMPIGFIKGLALTYAKAVCQPNRSDVLLVASKEKGDVKKDVFTHYGLSADAALLKTYQILAGLGMRESSGKYCCGRDMSAKFSTADSAEAGLFQTSWGVRVASPELEKLYDKYSKDDSGCLLDVFKEGVSPCGPDNAKNWGTGTGVRWQELTKRCPAFATEYAAIVLRKNGGSKGEFGPIRTKASEVAPACETMFSAVKNYVEKNSTICESFK